MKQDIDTIVFDLGGVLIDWNPRYYYREVFDSEKEMEYFLSHICNAAWNEQQDAGRTFKEATAQLSRNFPAYHKKISGYDHHWEKMMKNVIPESVALLQELKADQYRLYALTNWSTEKFPYVLQRFDFFSLFDGMVVSGEVGMVKPLAEIYQHLFKKFAIEPARAVFIDDSLKNVEAARKLGMHAIHFTNPEACRARLFDLLKA